MMNVLGRGDSTLEAPFLNYLSFGFFTLLSNLWTSLAYKLLRSSKSQLFPPHPDPEPVGDPPRVLCNGASDVDGVTKGKFTLYYSDRECESDDAVTEQWELEGDGRVVTEWWETLLRLRRGDTVNGWYTCQDLTVINGNVVRFWDGSGLTENSSCMYVFAY